MLKHSKHEQTKRDLYGETLYKAKHKIEFNEPKPTKGVLEREPGYVKASFNPDTRQVSLNFDYFAHSGTLFVSMFPFFRRIAVKEAKKAFPLMASLIYVNPLTKRKRIVSNKLKPARKTRPVKTPLKPINRRH